MRRALRRSRSRFSGGGVIEQVEKILRCTALPLTSHDLLRSTTVFGTKRRGNEAVGQNGRHVLSGKLRIDEMHRNRKLIARELAFLTDVGEIP